MRGRRGVRGAVAAVAAAVVALVATVPTAGSAPAQETGEAVGVEVVHDAVVGAGGRLHEVTLHSAALARQIKARVLLPAGYDDPVRAAERFPVLFLLHGASGSAPDWTERTPLEERTAGLDLIVVMPDGGPLGFYSDWLQGPAWEQHHVGELVPWVDAAYRTRGSRAGRAIAGLSMGGFGSMSYAARHPDLFVAAAAFSGAVAVADLGLAQATALQLLNLADDRRWGPYLTHEANWRGHNPGDLAGNLRWTRLRLSTGTGVPCPGDNPASAPIELGVFGMTTGFSLRLSQIGIGHSLETRPCGTHEWHHWDADLAEWLPSAMATFADPPPPPEAFDLRRMEAHVEAWGWTFTAHRPAVEALDLRAVSPAGLTLTGSGPVDVVTPAAFTPGAAYRLSTATAGVLTVPVALVPALGTVPSGEPPTSALALADGEGRLRFTVDLGPAHTADQWSPEGVAAEALAPGSYFRTAAVAIAAAPDAPDAPVAPAPRAPAAPSHGGTLPATGEAPPAWPVGAVAVALALRAVTRRLRPEGRIGQSRRSTA